MDCSNDRLSDIDSLDSKCQTFAHILTRHDDEQEEEEEMIDDQVDYNPFEMNETFDNQNVCERIDRPFQENDSTIQQNVDINQSNDSVSCLRSLLVGELSASHHMERWCQNGHTPLPTIKFDSPSPPPPTTTTTTIIEDSQPKQSAELFSSFQTLNAVQSLQPDSQLDFKPFTSEMGSDLHQTIDTPSSSTSSSSSSTSSSSSSTPLSSAVTCITTEITQTSSGPTLTSMKLIPTTTTTTTATTVVTASLPAVDTRLRDYQQKAVHSACTYNRQINFQRKEERMCSLDMQTYLFHYPIGLGIENRMLIRNSERGLCRSNGRYPVALLPGQFQEWYRHYTLEELKQIPLAARSKSDDKSIDLIGDSTSSVDMICECEQCSECGSESEETKDSMMTASSGSSRSSSGSSSSSESCTDSSEDEQENRLTFKKQMIKKECNGNPATTSSSSERIIEELKPAIVPVIQIPISTLLVTKAAPQPTTNKSQTKKTIAPVRNQVQIPQKKQFQIQLQPKNISVANINHSSPSVSLMKSKAQPIKNKTVTIGSQVQKLAQIRKAVPLRTVGPIKQSINKIQDIASSSSSKSSTVNSPKIVDQRTMMPLRLHILRQSDTELSVSLVSPKSSSGSLLQETPLKSTKTIVTESPAQVTIHPLPKTTTTTPTIITTTTTTTNNNTSIESSSSSISAEPICYLCKRPSLMNAEQNQLPTDPTEMLIQCTSCNNHIHPFCQDMTAEVVQASRLYSWQCTKCKRCTTCESVNEEGDQQLAICAKCDRGYHPHCVGMNQTVRQAPTSKWICALCAVCSQCGCRDAAAGVREKNGKLGWRLEPVKLITANGVICRHQLLCVSCHQQRKNKNSS